MTGLFDLPAGDYHADQLGDDRPALSKSIIHTLLTRSPAHARHAHSVLNPALERAEATKFDLGTSVHDLFLEGVDRLAIVPFDDWRTAAAKELRDLARANGEIPLLAHQADQVQDMVAQIRRQLDQVDCDPALFTNGKPEQTLVWEERGVLCKARLDWLRDDHQAVDDLKTTSRSANPEQWCRTTLYSIGADLQTAFYLRGCQAVFGVRPEFRFAVVETQPPYAVAVIALTPSVLEIANRKIDYALEVWARCLRDGSWPAYQPRVHWAELPAWEEARWIEREMREDAA